MERFAEVFTRLRGEAFWNYSIAYRTHDAHLALALARRVAPERGRPHVAGLIESTRKAVNGIYVEGYRRGLELAVEGGGFREADPLIREIRAKADALDEDLAGLERALLRMERREDRSFAPMRAAATTMMSFVLLGASAVAAEGCGGGSGGADGGVDSSADSAPRSDADRPDADGDAGVCTPEEMAADRAEVAAIASATDACFTGFARYEDLGAEPRVGAGASGSGMISGLNLRACSDDPATRAALDEMAERVRGALSARDLTCVEGFVSVRGGAAEQLGSMSDSMAECTSLLDFGTDLRIVLDPAGEVVEVRVVPPSPELSMCIEAALEGLSFPCLASFEVCPEFAIAE